jgi:Tfp pilus assembly protein PilO
MNKLSKEKRNQLILSVVMTLVVVVGLYFTLIRYQQSGVRKLTDDKAKVDSDLQRIRDTFNNSKQIEAELTVVGNQLQSQEQDMASGDLYSAMIAFITAFKKPYNIDIPQFNSGGAATEVNLLPKFPYKQVTISVAGTAYYYDLGRFVADFENRFPSSRILNLDLTPASAQNPDEREKLAFRMDIVSLVKPSNARPAKIQ